MSGYEDHQAMRKILLAACLSSTAALAPTLACAEIMIGGAGPSASEGNPLRWFSADAWGSDAASRQITGTSTQLYQPTAGVYEPTEQLIYVSDFNGRAILVYAAFASGNTAPLRVINPPSLGQTRDNAPVAAHDEIGVIVNNCCIATYPLHANGNAVAAIRTIASGSGADTTTKLNNPASLVYLPATDEYAVKDYDTAPPQATRIVFHARTANGTVAPTRLLTGAGVANAVNITYDARSHRLFVLRQPPLDGNSVSHGSIAIFDANASGDAQPLATIEGAATGLDMTGGYYFRGIGFDPYLSRLMVSSYSSSNNPALNRVIAFDYSATTSGNVAPVQQLQGSNVSPYIAGKPFAVPAEVIFRGGFEPVQHAR